MNRFFQSLAFKLSLAIFCIASVLLSSLGIYYIRSFAEEIDQSLYTQAQIPGHLMNDGVVPLSLAQDAAALSRLIGEEVLLSVIDQPDNLILFCSDPALEGTKTDEFHAYAHLPGAVTTECGSVIVHRRNNGTGHVFISTPLHLEGGKAAELHMKISASNAHLKKLRVAGGFSLGFIFCILLITGVCALLLHFLTVPRLRNTLHCLKAVENGDFTARIARARS